MKTRRGILVILQNGPIEDDLRVQREIVALRDSNYQVSVICPDVDCDKSKLDIDGIHFFRYPPPNPGNDFKSYVGEYLYSWIQTTKLSIKVYKEVGFDAIHACNPPDIFFPLGIFYKAFRRKFVFDQHDLSPEMYLSRFSNTDPKLYKALRLFEYLTYKIANMVIVTNDSYKSIASQRGKISEEHIYVVRNGPYLRFSKPAAFNPELKMGHKFLICCMGQIAPQDGVDYLIRAADYLINQKGRKDTCFALVGDGSSVEELKKMTEEMSIAEHIVFTGWIRDRELLRSYLATADICVSPEPKSTFNEHSTFIKVLDYMSAGKPIIAFDLPETRFSAGEAALYAEPNSEIDLADKIDALLSNEELRHSMGKYGQKRVESMLLWEHSKPNLIKAYDNLFMKGKTVKVGT
ncbi:MAG: glycosyltransferase family 4 protein [Actinobacteria bacterium]|nr:glycosyltransferase family 4 protein [Actinomycetota bacterium]